jgi:hypothetical protein
VSVPRRANIVFAGILVVVANGGCGRVWFEPLTDSGGAMGSADAEAVDLDVLPSCGHTFCDDFDRGGPVEAGWDTITNSGLAVPSLTTDRVITAPQAFLVQLPGTSLESTYLVKQLPMTTTTAVIAVQLDYTTTNVNDAEIDLIALNWDSPPAPCTTFGYYLVRDGTMQFNLQETYGGTGCAPSEQNYLPALDNTGYHALVMTVTFGAANSTARIALSIDGTTVIDHTTSHAIPASTLTLRLGAGASRNVVAPWEFRYDDLTVDLQ